MQSTTIKTQQAYKQRVKSYLLEVQCTGISDEWQNENFKLIQAKGLRQSARTQN